MEHLAKFTILVCILGTIMFLTSNPFIGQVQADTLERVSSAARKDIGRIERLLSTLETTKKSMEAYFEDRKSYWCVAGASEYCPEVEEPTEDVWDISRYYSPMPGQKKYLYVFRDYNLGLPEDPVEAALITTRETEPERRARLCVPGNTKWIGPHSRTRGDYDADFCVNAQGSSLHTADGTDLRKQSPYRVLACPPELPFGTRMEIEGIGTAVCRDRGGAIKNKRLDLWTGVGDNGYNNLLNGPHGGLRTVTITFTPVSL